MQYNGDGSTTIFPYNFLILADTDLEVIETVIATGVETVKTLTTHYTVSGVKAGSGNVTMVTAPASGTRLTIRRITALTQLVHYVENDPFPATTHEQVVDKLTMIAQDNQETLNRAVKVPKSSTLTDIIYPDPSLTTNQGKLLRIRADGTGFDAVATSTAPFADPLTTKGDLLGRAAGADVRIPVGTDGSLLIAASGQASGVKYLAPGTDGYVLRSDSAQPDKLVWVAPNQPGNPIINGNMEIWQRGTSFVSPASGTYTADRWRVNHNTDALVTVNRSTNVPSVAQAGVLFNYSLEIDVTTADTAIGAIQHFELLHSIEGYNWRHFAQRQFTLSFWVMSPKAGIHCVRFTNSATDRTYIAEYTVNAANTWEFKTITVPASPSAGTWDYTTGVGLSIQWVLALGGSFGTAGVWQTGVVLGTSNQVNVLDSTTNFFRITGVKPDLGSVATPIQFRAFQDELNLAKRYYQKSFPYTTAPASSAGAFGVSTFTSAVTGVTPMYGMHVNLQTMRVSPTITLYNPASAGSEMRNYSSNANFTSTTAPSGYISSDGFQVQGSADATASPGHVLAIHWTADAEL